MARDPRYDVLFEPVRLGPVTARNRFYQAPHCNGMGRNHPSPMAEMRGVKAEGGWAVVFTEIADIHHSSDSAKNLRLWDEQDFPIHGRVVEKVHAHGSLAGVQLSHLGFCSANLIGREVSIAPSARTVRGLHPAQAMAMDLSDIRAFRHWHRQAALNAKAIGYDVVQIYAAHDLGLPMHFLSRKQNQRADEYGGSLENRVRLLRELIEDAKDAVGDRCAVGVRLCVDELAGPDGLTADGEGRDVIEMLAELPDFWDVNIGAWPDDSATSRFHTEGHQEAYVSIVKPLTSRPVIGVGRFTSPDTMVGQIKRGVLDMIGAARPSIADPFLPLKIEEGREDEIRECIGCNVCITYHSQFAPSRCTQNPTFGEEWRRGWHPERVPPKDTDDRIIIVGAGPAGLEAVRVLGLRGYQVLLAEAEDTLGGRVTLESGLPGLAAWARVRDYRLQQLDKLDNVEIYPASRMGVDDILETGCTLVGVATGASWRRDGIGKSTLTPIPGADLGVMTPDDIMSGTLPSGHVLIYDDDHYYMGGVIAERLVEAGCTVTIATPELTVSRYAELTLENAKIVARLMGMGVTIMPGHRLSKVEADGAELACVFTGAIRARPMDALVMVAGRNADRSLVDSVTDRAHDLSVEAIGDCRAPGTIAAAVYAGHRFGRDLSLAIPDQAPFHREDVILAGN